MDGVPHKGAALAGMLMCNHNRHFSAYGINLFDFTQSMTNN